MFGFYMVEKSLVKGKPSYTSEHEEGAYAVWYDEYRNWCLGPSSMRGKKEWHCNFYADGKVHSGGDDFCPTDTDYVWRYSSRNGGWKPTNHGFKIISAHGNFFTILLLFDKISCLTKENCVNIFKKCFKSVKAKHLVMKSPYIIFFNIPNI